MSARGAWGCAVKGLGCLTGCSVLRHESHTREICKLSKTGAPNSSRKAIILPERMRGGLRQCAGGGKSARQRERHEL